MLKLPHNYKVGIKRLRGLFKNSVIQYHILIGIRGEESSVVIYNDESKHIYYLETNKWYHY